MVVLRSFPKLQLHFKALSLFTPVLLPLQELKTPATIPSFPSQLSASSLTGKYFRHRIEEVNLIYHGLRVLAANPKCTH